MSELAEAQIPDAPDVPPAKPKPKRKPVVYKAPPRPILQVDPEVAKEAAITALEAGEEPAVVAKRLGLERKTVHRWNEDLDKAKSVSVNKSVAKGLGSSRGPLQRQLRSPEELALAREIDARTYQRTLFLIVQGGQFRKVNADLAKKGLNKITARQYMMICNLPQVLQSREALGQIAIEGGIGNKFKRIQQLAKLAEQTATRIREELSRPSLDIPALKVLLPEYREYSKEVSIETGERVENINIDALIRGMSPRQLLDLAEVNEGEVVDIAAAADGEYSDGEYYDAPVDDDDQGADDDQGDDDE